MSSCMSLSIRLSFNECMTLPGDNSPGTVSARTNFPTHPGHLTRLLKRKFNKCVSRTDTNPPFAFDIAFFGQGFTGFLQGVQGRLKRYVRCLYGYFWRLLRYVKSANGQKFEFFFEFLGPPCRNRLANVDGSMPECA